MSSRLVKNPTTLFEVFLEFRVSQLDNNDIIIKDEITKFPEDYNDQDKLRSIKDFAFPWKTIPNIENAIQLFTFALTDGKGEFTFGHSRYSPRTSTCMCFLSTLPWQAFFVKILNYISKVTNDIGNARESLSVIKNFGVPIPDTVLYTVTGPYQLAIPIPGKVLMPSIKDSQILLDFYNAMPENNMEIYYISLLKERRIIFTGTKISQVSSCCFAADHLLFPFNWQGIFIPILPPKLVDTLMAPMPYIIGLHKEIFDTVNMDTLGDVVIFDIDEKTIISPHHDDTLPFPIHEFLKNKLKYLHDNFLTESLTKIFLSCNVLLFGKYMEGFLKELNGKKCLWNKKLFIDKQHPVLKDFIRELMGKDGVQYFERFIVERIEKINDGKLREDVFERECGTIIPQLDKILSSKNTKINVENAISSIKNKFTKINLKDLTKPSKQESSKKRFSKFNKTPSIISSIIYLENDNDYISKIETSPNVNLPNLVTNSFPTKNIYNDDNKLDNDSIKSKIEEDLITFDDDTIDSISSKEEKTNEIQRDEITLESILNKESLISDEKMQEILKDVFK
ncbi:DENN domain and dDENN domain and uDENN domain-containing protein [Strongyloides ratti]|uniref:DENN domain and dDENN domain and uDENN domain-containing protein n=1 Tax=Strongyloides ratti TaxID=34506 RepID=A0A090KQ15_STRRB|nr:DENN domain and dDENN domain and uDENN domain-containing protein [Strongyloides ratti]CEF59474.1 DENN domain and dDENN domain and uDENN domain-containing protein [Strongyloides ratti]